MVVYLVQLLLQLLDLYRDILWKIFLRFTLWRMGIGLRNYRSGFGEGHRNEFRDNSIENHNPLGKH